MPKSVIEIDVNDEKFKAFVASFNKFNEAIADVNAQMAELGKKTTEAADTGEKGFKKFTRELSDFKAKAQDSVAPFVKIASVTKQIALSVAGTAFSLAKWAAFGAIGSGFGLGTLASSVVNTRREALAYNTTPGALRAARVAYGRYADVDALLGNIAGTQFNPETASAYSVLGITGQRNKSPIQLLNEIARQSAAKYEQYKSNPEALRLISPLLSPEQMRIFAGSRGELGEAAKTQARLAPGYETTDKAFQNFYTALHEAGETIETSMIGALNKLTPVLSQLALKIADIFKKFTNSPDFDRIMDDMSNAILKFVNYLSSPEFNEDLKQFGSLVSDLAHLMADAISVLGPVLHGIVKAKQMGDDIYTVGTALPKFVIGGLFSKPLAERLNNPGDIKDTAGNFMKFSSTDEGLRAMYGRLRQYQRQGLNTVDAIAHKYYSGEPEDKIQRAIKFIAERAGISGSQNISGANVDTMSSLMSVMTKIENSRSNFTPQQIKLVIQNDTASNVIGSANALYTANPQ